MAHWSPIPFRGWFLSNPPEPASRLRVIGDVRDGRHPEHPDLPDIALGDRCDRCGYAPMTVFLHGHHGELQLCGHDANAAEERLEAAGWVVALDRRERTAERWRNDVAQ